MTEMPGKSGPGQKIAVIGGGVAGIVSAYLLQQQHEVTLFEQNDYLGGHTHTIEVGDGPDAGLAVDTGFIVLNDATYPLFLKFLARVGVCSRVSDM
jgi:predicted NAD/FAD-binding protein